MDGILVAEYLLGFENVNNERLDSISEHDIISFLGEIKTKDIDRIEMVRPNDGIIEKFGVKAANGLIAIYSKQGNSPILDEKTDMLAQVWMPGVSMPEAFITSNYRTDINEEAMPRRRATIYWNPNVRTNRKGRAKIGFYNSDDARTLQICVEGISDEGVPIFSIYEIGRNSGRGKVN
jgi:hypothetical protein